MTTPAGGGDPASAQLPPRAPLAPPPLAALLRTPSTAGGAGAGATFGLGFQTHHFTAAATSTGQRRQQQQQQ